MKHARREIAFILCVAIVCVLSFVQFLAIKDVAGLAANPSGKTVKASATKHVEDIETTMEKWEALCEMRKRSMQTALGAESARLYPVALFRDYLIEGETDVPEGTLSDAVPGDRPAPGVFIRGIMRCDGAYIALIDIAEAESGVIVKPGSVFLNGEAKVLSIDARRVAYEWRKKSFEAEWEK